MNRKSTSVTAGNAAASRANMKIGMYWVGISINGGLVVTATARTRIAGNPNTSVKREPHFAARPARNHE